MAKILRDVSLLKRSLFQTQVLGRGILGTSYQQCCFATKANGDIKSILAEAAIKGVAEARAAIFGHVLNPTGQRTSHKILRKKLIGHNIAAYYPIDTVGNDPQMADRKEHQRLAKLQMLKRRGKAPPKKGQGKRASKRK